MRNSKQAYRQRLWGHVRIHQRLLRPARREEYLGENTERHRLGLRGEWEFVSVDAEEKEGKLREKEVHSADMSVFLCAC